MPLYIDIHRNRQGLSPEALAEGHARDLAVEEKYGVKFLRYWYDLSTGTIFCLGEAPSAKAFQAVHREAQGDEGRSDEIYEVKEGA
jgi:Protein of unknown function (DUF4242)